MRTDILECSFSQTLKRSIGDVEYQQFLHYVKFLRRWSAVYNLMSRRDLADDNLIALHALDAVALVEVLENQRIPTIHAIDNSKNIQSSNFDIIIDIGAGNGIQGLLLKLFLPKSRVFLVDRKFNIICFLEYVIAQLALENTYCIKADISQRDNIVQMVFDSLSNLHDILRQNETTETERSALRLRIIFVTKALLSLERNIEQLLALAEHFAVMNNLASDSIPILKESSISLFLHISISQLAFIETKIADLTKIYQNSSAKDRVHFILHKHPNYYRNESIILEIVKQT